jgi:4-amino-4-deoxy-L-arabinose transferase-like glycosyltransferase
VLLTRHIGLSTSPVVLSATFTALGVLAMNRILYRLLPRRPVRLLVLALYATNPMIVIYAINGMSESLLVLFVLVSVWCIQRLLDATESGANGSLPPLLGLMGVSAGVAFLTRYEGALLGLTILPGIFLALAGRKYSRSSYEAYFLIYLLPFGYAVFVWLLANGLMMGNPLYFIFGTHRSDRDLGAAAMKSFLDPTRHSVVQAAIYAVTIPLRLYPAYFVALALLLVLAVVRRHRLALFLALLLASFPALQVPLMYTDFSLGWYRFYIYLIPLTIVGIAVLMTSVPARLRLVASAAGIVAIALSSAFTYVVVAHPTSVYTPGWYALNYEPYFVQAVLGGKIVDDYHTMRELADYLQTNLPNARILADERQADAIMLFDGNIGRYVMSRSPNYHAVVDDPVGQIDYILVCDSVSGSQNFIVERHPGVFQNGAPFLQLVREWTEQNPSLPTHWRLYRVVSPASRSA